MMQNLPLGDFTVLVMSAKRKFQWIQTQACYSKVSVSPVICGPVLKGSDARLIA